MAPEGFVRRDFVHMGYRMAIPGFVPQHSIYYQLGLQEKHKVAGNSNKDSPVVVDNFETGQTGFSLGIAGNHKAVGLQTEPKRQAAFDRLVGIEIQLAFEDQIGFGAQPGAENRVELEKQQSFECLVEQAQKDVLERTKVEPSSQKVDPAEIEIGLSAQKVELVGK